MRGLGYIKDVFDGRDRIYAAPNTNMGPRARVDLREELSDREMLHIHNQVDTSACVGFAAVGAIRLRSLIEVEREMRTTSLPILSGLAAYTGGRQTGGYFSEGDHGSRPRDVIQFLRMHGCVPETRWALLTDHGAGINVDDPIPLDVLQHGVEGKVESFTRILGSHTVLTKNLRYALQEGFPVVCAQEVDQTFMDWCEPESRTMPMFRGDPLGGHMTYLGGYRENAADRTGVDFLVLNSWGLDWGTDGVAWIPGSRLDDHGSDFYKLTIAPESVS